MSDVSTFVKRGQSDTEKINKLQTLITPIAFGEPEIDGDKERIILSTPLHEKVQTVSTTDSIVTGSETRDRFSNSITLLPDTSTPSAFPVTPTVTGTLTFTPSGQKFGAGATFSGTQYIEIPDDNQLDLTLPIFTMAFWFKSNGTDEGKQIVWSKGSFVFDRDFCLGCGDWDTDDYSIVGDTTATAGLQVRLEANTVEDHCSACGDFDATYNAVSAVEEVRIIISDGTNTVDQSLSASNLFDGNWHSIIIISDDSVSDYCSSCGDYNTDYIGATTPVITVYMDKVSIGTIDHSSISGDLSNALSAYIGTGSTGLEDPLKGNLALFEYQGTNWTTSDVDAYHDDARIRVTSQKAAFHFTGNSTEETTLANIY